MLFGQIHDLILAFNLSSNNFNIIWIEPLISDSNKDFVLLWKINLNVMLTEPFEISFPSKVLIRLNEVKCFIVFLEIKLSTS